MVAPEISDLQAHLERELRKSGQGIVFAYLFGSVAKGVDGPNSDVDVAVYLADLPQGREGDRLAVDRQIQLAGDLERTLARPVDVVILNRLPPDVIHNILGHGILVFCNDQRERIRVGMAAFRGNDDLQSIRSIFRRYMRRRIEGGTFGGGRGNSTQAP